MALLIICLVDCSSGDFLPLLDVSLPDSALELRVRGHHHHGFAHHPFEVLDFPPSGSGEDIGLVKD